MASDSSTCADPFETEERRALRDLAARFAEREIVPYLDDWEAAGELPRDLHRRAAAAGLLGLGFPEEVGGSGGDMVDVLVMTEGLIGAGASGGIIAGLFTHGIALPHVVDEVARRRAAGDGAGAEHLLERIVRPVLAGESIIALGVTEPDGGSDVAALRTTARRHDDGSWRISGAKTFITSGVRADHVVVAARTGSRDEGAAGISLLVVDRDAPGYAVPQPLAKMGWHCSDTALLAFEDCPVGPLGLLGEADGFASLARHFVAERLSIAATAYATAQRSLDLTLAWARERETFGRPLAQRQVIRHQLVEVHRRTDVARCYARDIAVRHARGEQVALGAALAKETAVEACMLAVDRSVQVHGGLGYMRGTEVERHYRDARVLGIGGGATEVMTDLAARLLGW